MDRDSKPLVNWTGSLVALNTILRAHSPAGARTPSAMFARFLKVGTRCGIRRSVGNDQFDNGEGVDRHINLEVGYLS